MEIKKYTNINETVYFEKLDNGLTIKIIPKVGFKKVYACFATNYGSLTNKFIPYGEDEYIEVPLGIAHFLEHKLFAQENGEDAANIFASLGLEANAYTDYTETVYLFSGNENIEKGIELLLDFVQKPYFTDENVKSEIGIIEQELLMYMDMPSDRLHNGLMRNMFAVYPLKFDIGGTTETIKKIDKETLYKCYNTFYHPSNMLLTIVGGVDPKEIFDLVKQNQAKKNFPIPLDIKRNFLVESEVVAEAYDEIYMDVTYPKVAVGLKIPFEKSERNTQMMKELYMKIILESKMGISSDFYQELLDEDLITNHLSSSVFFDDKCGFIKLSASSKNPGLLIERINKKLMSLKNIKLTNKEFERYKKSALGSFLKGLNSLSFIATSSIEYDFKDCDLFSSIELLEKSTLDDIKKMGKYFCKSALSAFVVLPKQWKKD